MTSRYILLHLDKRLISDDRVDKIQKTWRDPLNSSWGNLRRCCGCRYFRGSSNIHLDQYWSFSRFTDAIALYYCSWWFSITSFSLLLGRFWASKLAKRRATITIRTIMRATAAYMPKPKHTFAEVFSLERAAVGMGACALEVVFLLSPADAKFLVKRAA